MTNITQVAREMEQGSHWVHQLWFSSLITTRTIWTCLGVAGVTGYGPYWQPCGNFPWRENYYRNKTVITYQSLTIISWATNTKLSQLYLVDYLLIKNSDLSSSKLLTIRSIQFGIVKVHILSIWYCQGPQILYSLQSNNKKFNLP